MRLDGCLEVDAAGELVDEAVAEAIRLADLCRFVPLAAAMFSEFSLFVEAILRLVGVILEIRDENVIRKKNE